MRCCYQLKITLLCLFGLIVCAGRVDASEKLSLGGYFKNFSVVYDLPDIVIMGSQFNGKPLGSVSNRLRLNARWEISDKLDLSVSYDIAPRIQDHLLFEEYLMTSATSGTDYRVDDFDSRLYPEPDDDVNSFALYQNLDRLFATVRTDIADIFVGRQAIAFGSARVVNPTDIVAPYSYETLDTEDRLGVDAVRVRAPLGFMGEIDAGYVFGEDFKFGQSAVFLRGKTYFAHTDVSAIVMGFRENVMLGLDVARSIGGAGFWFEAAHVFVDALADEKTPGERDYFRLSTGLDYNMGGNTYGFFEYHFNQAGGELDWSYRKVPYREGNVYLMGRHYAIPGVTFQITPLLTGSGEAIVNMSDWSAYLSPSLEYNLAENVYLSGGVYLGWDLEGRYSGDGNQEFTSYPDTYYSSFRFYF